MAATSRESGRERAFVEVKPIDLSLSRRGQSEIRSSQR